MPAAQRSIAFTFAFCLLALTPSWSWAEDEAPPAETLLDELTALTKEEAFDALVDVVAKVPEIYLASEDDRLRGKLRGALGKIAREKDAGDARFAAIDALQGIEDPKGAWKEISKLMPKGKEDEASPIDLAVVKAAGVLAQSRSVKALGELAMKAKDPALAAVAAVSLGGFREDKRNRVKILEELIKVGQRTRPGRSTEKATSTVALERWAAVEKGVVTGLNTLTGRSLGGFEDWEVLYKDNKKRPAALFLDEEE